MARRGRSVGGALALALALPARGAGAQQWITDDASLTDDGACLIQVWHGQRSSWVLPACTPIRNLELSLGFIALREREGGHFEYVMQGKTLVRPLRADDWGAGLVLGTGRDPALAGTNPDVTTFYAYVPLGLSLGGDRVVLHQNVGWQYQHAGDEGEWSGRHALTWAARADVALGGARRRPVVVVEAYGAEGASGVEPEFQVGLRASPRPGVVQLDVSWGGFLRSGGRAAGWTLGLTLSTPPFL